MADSPETVEVNQRVVIQGREELGAGQVLRVEDVGGIQQADVLFEQGGERRLETVEVTRLRPARDLWERLAAGDFDPPVDFLLKQLAYQFPLENSGGQLSNSRTQLLPHQILLTYDVINLPRRRLLVADEVGLGKTIETGMILRELMARGEAERVLVVCPAGLTKNWRDELEGCFRLHFEILGLDFNDAQPAAWERHNRVIASIDKLKVLARMERLTSGPAWDVIVFDEAHHLTRRKSGGKLSVTQNYRLADALRLRTRDLLFLSATPHQGDSFQFWSLLRLLDDQLFSGPEAMLDHRGLLNRVMVRRTKREVTDARGHPIFMRRQVQSQIFTMGMRERRFYETLTEYLKTGYETAGLGQAKTTSAQRAIGFVMTTFQKIMSSSPRAIKQALRRRLLVLLARQQMALEARQSTGRVSTELAATLLRLTAEMRALAAAIEKIPRSPSQTAEADAVIARVKQRLARRASEELTEWSLDAEEDLSEAIFSDVEIPDETQKVRELLQLVPDGTDRKFDTLIRAIEAIRRESPREKFLIFTQYRETQEFLYDEMAKLYGREKIALLHGGPLEDKIAAVEKFWESEGAQFLVSTTAGGEGINLQVCHILFNYDLPWNPMAVEQRIGRVHRYGQQDTVQVYNLVAEDTVEQRIYQLLEEKLLEIARTIGKVDPQTHEVSEDFRSEILGFLGSSPNYLELYRKALVDRDYRRTEREIAEAIEKARQSSEALRNLAQELETFNLEHYRRLESRFTLEDLRLFVEKAVIRLGGAILPDGETWRIETPPALRGQPRVSARYESVTFDRAVAMRKRNTELLGLGHPLVDALIAYLKRPVWKGDVACLSAACPASALSTRWLVTMEMDDGKTRQVYSNIVAPTAGGSDSPGGRADLEALATSYHPPAQAEIGGKLLECARRSAEASLHDWLSRTRAEQDGVRGFRIEQVGLAVT
jgi:superfamily II DNA or RNA helicase